MKNQDKNYGDKNYGGEDIEKVDSKGRFEDDVDILENEITEEEKLSSGNSNRKSFRK